MRIRAKAIISMSCALFAQSAAAQGQGGKLAVVDSSIPLQTIAAVGSGPRAAPVFTYVSDRCLDLQISYVEPGAYVRPANTGALVVESHESLDYAGIWRKSNDDSERDVFQVLKNGEASGP